MKNWMAALLLTGACCGLVACNDDEGNTPPPAPDATAVIGAYNGTMDVYNIAPNEGEGEGEAPTGTPIDATVTGDLIQFNDFPIRDLIIQVLGDATLADQIVEKIGKVEYSIAYTALMNEDQTGVALTLAPEPLKLTLPNDSGSGEPESFEEPTSIEIEVEIITQIDGAYGIESKTLEFGISAASVKLSGEALPGFEPFSLDFNLAKN